MNRYLELLLAAFFMMATVTDVCAGCEIVDGDKKMPFDGVSIGRILVEKRSLVILNELYPNLNVVERTFKGEILTCSNCSEKHISCAR